MRSGELNEKAADSGVGGLGHGQECRRLCFDLELMGVGFGAVLFGLVALAGDAVAVEGAFGDEGEGLTGNGEFGLRSSDCGVFHIGSEW